MAKECSLLPQAKQVMQQATTEIATLHFRLHTQGSVTLGPVRTECLNCPFSGNLYTTLGSQKAEDDKSWFTNTHAQPCEQLYTLLANYYHTLLRQNITLPSHAQDN